MPGVFTILLVLPAAVFLYWVVVPTKWKSLFLLIGSFLLILSISFQYTVYLFCTILLTFTAANFSCPDHHNRKQTLLFTLVWLIACLCFFKYANAVFQILSQQGIRLSSDSNKEFPGILLPIGISYITFRLIHYLIEAYRGNTPKSSFQDFALYVLFFPTFFAGPIERFQNFHSQTTDNKNFELSDLHYGVFRIACGVIKKVLIVYYLTKWVLPILHSPEDFSRSMVIISIYGLAVLIYMDFSGYTDIAIGSARLFGYKIMENFHYPFFKKNIALFWRSWHISLYTWMRDYFFFPLFGWRASVFKLYSGIFFTMLLLHCWHEVSLSFLFLGLYHASGLIVWQLFQDIKKKYPLLKDLGPEKLLTPVSTAFTFSFVSLGFVFFHFDFFHSVIIIKRIVPEFFI